ncbi:hypothetical protein EWM64_g9045 [Hericium alpestre]|uniref:Uncharacterized protein n=1 Tax=Hericium alpestre TaxID=135208 RepID=A0A4Y9ZLJ6_9AGAM|nr:hypothetical protein EWM64_g9045 [Hericium alpestre]
MMFESLEDYFDCICLGLTCRLLWSVARPHVKKRYIEDALGSWAGDRIICAGSRSARDDPLPAGMLTEEEESEWKGPLPTEGCRCGGEHEPDVLADNLYFWAECAFTDDMSPAKVRPKLEQRAVHDSWRRRFDWDDYGLLKSVLDIPQKPVVQEVKLARPVVLRNLSRKLYVREDVIEQFMEENQHLLSRGPWAGDRFDFVSAKDFRAVESGDDDQAVEWTDATAEAVRDIKLLWEEARRVWS